MAITCCKGCKPPERTPTCHFDGTCTKYMEQKEKHDAMMKEIKRRRALVHNLYEQRGNAVRKAQKYKKDRGNA